MCDLMQVKINPMLLALRRHLNNGKYCWKSHFALQLQTQKDKYLTPGLQTYEFLQRSGL